MAVMGRVAATARCYRRQPTESATAIAKRISELATAIAKRGALGCSRLPRPPAPRPQPGNRDHNSLDVVGGDPAGRGGVDVGGVGGRRCIRGDRGGQRQEHELARRNGKVLGRRGGEFGECVKDGCLGSHGALPGYSGMRGCWPRWIYQYYTAAPDRRHHPPWVSHACHHARPGLRLRRWMRSALHITADRGKPRHREHPHRVASASRS